MTRDPIARQMPTLAPKASRRKFLKGLAAAAAIPAATATASVSADAAIFAHAPHLEQLEAKLVAAHQAYKRGGQTEDLEEAWEGHLSVYCGAVDEMMAIPAVTMEGLMFKAKYAHTDPLEGPASIADDLRALQGMKGINVPTGRGGF